MFNVKNRNLTDELMDDPGLNPHAHQKALDALRRINWVTAAYRPITREIVKLGMLASGPLHVLDIACGGGDLLCAIDKKAKKENVRVILTGQDISDEALRIARSRARKSGRRITFNVGDVFDMDQAQSYDVICCSLFLHHLTRTRAIDLLRLMKRLARQLVLVADLKRTSWGYMYALFGPRLLTRSPIVHIDGVKSVRGAFSMDEVRELAKEAGLESAELESFWPQRFLLRWNKQMESSNGQ